MELLEALTETFDHATKIVAGVRPDQLDLATPCRDWQLRELIAHMIGVVTSMGRGARGEPLEGEVAAVVLTDDLGAQLRGVADRTLAAWTERGSDGEVNIGAGPMPPALGITINLIDTATHSWDIARASGQDADLPDALAEYIANVARAFVTDEIRVFGFEPATPVSSDANPTEQLAAFLGRQP